MRSMKEQMFGKLWLDFGTFRSSASYLQAFTITVPVMFVSLSVLYNITMSLNDYDKICVTYSIVLGFISSHISCQTFYPIQQYPHVVNIPCGYV